MDDAEYDRWFLEVRDAARQEGRDVLAALVEAGLMTPDEAAGLA